MSTAPHEPSLIVELDQRQNEVLAQLDELNDKVEQLLTECLSLRNLDGSLPEGQRGWST